MKSYCSLRSAVGRAERVAHRAAAGSWGWRVRSRVTCGHGRVALLCASLAVASSAAAQDRGAPIRADSLDTSSAQPDHPAPRAGEPVADDGVMRRPIRRRRYRDPEAEHAPEPAEPTRAASSEPAPARATATTEAAAHGRRRVRRRADFDGAHWDAPEPVELDQPSAIDGAFRFGLELSVLDVESTSLQTSSAATVGPDLSTANYGLTKGAGAGLLMGVGLSNAFVLNGRLIFANTHVSYDGGAGDQLRFQLMPSLEYVLGSALSNVRVFGALAVGLMLGDTPAVPLSFNELSFLLGGQLGVHLFPARHVSIDPALLLGYRFGTASVDPIAADGLGGAGMDYTLSGIVLILSLGISYWS